MLVPMGLIVVVLFAGGIAWLLRGKVREGHRDARRMLLLAIGFLLVGTLGGALSYLHESGRALQSPITSVAALTNAPAGEVLLLSGRVLPWSEEDEWAHTTDGVLRSEMRVALDDGEVTIRPGSFRGGERYRIDERGVRAHAEVVVEGSAFDYDDGSRVVAGLLFGGTPDEYRSFTAWDPYPPLAAALLGLLALLPATLLLITTRSTGR